MSTLIAFHPLDWVRWFVGSLLLMFVFGLKSLPQQSTYSFGVPQKELVHLDGEVRHLPGGAKVTVSVLDEAILGLR